MRINKEIRRASRLALAAGMLAGLSGCTDAAGYDLDRFWGKIAIFSTLRTSVAYGPNEMPRLPAPGTVPVVSPRGDETPLFPQAALDSAAATLTNPLQPTPEVLARGEAVYHNSCYACHGDQGKGSGPVVGPGKFPFAPAIDGSTGVVRSEGYVYAVVRVGRGLMPSYGERMDVNDRWAVATYVHHLAGQHVAASAPAGAMPAAPPPAAPAPVAPGGTR